MPAPLAVDKEAVRVLVVAVGVREAARRMDLDENTVKSWSRRGGWLMNCQPTQAFPLSMQPKPRAPDAPNAANALSDALADDSKASRLSLSRGLRRVAAHVEQLPPDEALAEAQNIKATVGSLSTVHGWDANKGQTTNVLVSVSMLGMQPAEIEVESIVERVAE